LQKGEVLDLNFYNTDPTGFLGTPPTAQATTVFLKFDGINSEDLVVILKLVDPDDGTTTTKAIIIENSDIYKTQAAVPAGFGIVLDQNDGAVIIESNDYNLLPGENWVIEGMQILTSNEGITGTGINLNSATGAGGGSTTTQAFDAADNDVIKVSDIGFIATTTTTLNADLDFSVAVQDADGDVTSTQTLNVDIVGGSTFTGSAEADAIQGSSGNDTIDGGAGHDHLSGLVGNDTLIGGDGNDTIGGGAGNDSIDGGNNTDLLDFSDGTSGISITLVQGAGAAIDLSAAGLGTDTYKNMEGVIGTSHNDTLNGSSSNDLLFGGGGNDSLSDGAGADTITGGLGNDTISLAADATGDTIHYTSVLDGHDVITGFKADANHDTLSLDGLFDLLGVATASRAALVQVVDDGGGNWTVNVNADAAPGFELTVASITVVGGGTVNTGEEVNVGTA
jgi:Ca2+-binding RTX toxin-like protein